MHHFRDLVEVGEKKLSVKEKQEFYPVLFSLMEENMKAILQTLCSKLITDPVCFQKSSFTKPDYEKEEVRQTFHSIVLLPLFYHNSIFFFLFPKSIFFDFKTPSS